MTQRKTLKQTSKEVCREALLDAAQSLLAERGFEGTTVESIARRAGVAKGTFYLHFSGKEEIFRSLIHDQMERILREAERIAASGSTARGRLVSIAEILLAFHSRSSHAWLSLIHDKSLDRKQVMAHFREKRQRMIGILREVIGGGMGTGEILPDDTDRIAALFIGCVQGMVHRWFDTPGPVDVRGEATWLVDRLFSGIAAPSAGGEQ